MPEICIPILREVTLLSICARLGLAILVGGILGIERGMKHRPAGMITYALVCMGAALIMITNQFIASVIPGTDPTRLGAQVISGIGFLGAGTIIVRRNDEVRGLTTAAGLWVTAGLGLAIGVGFYMGAVLATLFYIFAVIILRKIDVYVKQHARYMEVYMEYNADFSVRTLVDFAEKQSCEIHDLKHSTVATLNEKLGTLTFTVKLSNIVNHQKLLHSFYSVPGVEYIHEIA